MPSALTYPGVYIEEIPSGVRTISGVATSIAAFVGWAPQGPTDRALRVSSFSDYQRFYGPIHPRSYLGYSVRQFFDNGGSDAYVLRLSAKDAQGVDLDASGTCDCGGLSFKASSGGTWSDFYGVQVKARDGVRFTVSVVQFAVDATGKPITSGDDLKKSPPSVLEVFTNLSADQDSDRYAKEIINDEQHGSLYVKWVSGDAATTADPAPFQGGTLIAPDDIDEINDSTKPWMAQAVNAAQTDAVLDKIDLFNLLCVPGLTDRTALGSLTTFCRLRRAMLIADCAKDDGFQQLKDGPQITGDLRNAAFYFPWLKAPDPLSQGRTSDFPPCGFVAGSYAKTDASRGVWKAPAGTEAKVIGAIGPTRKLTDNENGILNVKAVNCIRTFAVPGTVTWGARTMDGDDETGSEWKYIPVRRTALFIEETLFRATQWVVFEPNDEPLWAQLRLNIGAFMHDLFRQGAFQGRTPREAYFVKCDGETTTQNDINRGIVNIIVGFAPLKPAEFVVIKLTQIAGQIET